MFSKYIQNDFTVSSLPSNSFALISAYSSSPIDTKLNHMFTARFEQFKVFTQVKFNSMDGLLYCNALDYVAVLKFDIKAGFQLVSQYAVLNGDLMKDFFLFQSGKYRNAVTADNDKVFAYVDQFNKVKFKFK